MRVISGIYKGKIIKGFDIDGTRPTMDRIKESLFAMIQEKIPKSICLDLFAGSGSLGIEALSNGSDFCYFVDSSPKILPILKENLKEIPHCEVIASSYNMALEYFKNQQIQFDIVFLDPPYRQHLINSVIDLLIEKKLLKKQAIVICEYENEIIQRNDLKLLKKKKYGNKNIKIYEI